MLDTLVDQAVCNAGWAVEVFAGGVFVLQGSGTLVQEITHGGLVLTRGRVRQYSREIDCHCRRPINVGLHLRLHDGSQMRIRESRVEVLSLDMKTSIGAMSVVQAVGVVRKNPRVCKTLRALARIKR